MGNYLKKIYGIEKQRIAAVYNMGSLQKYIDRVNRFANTIFTVKTQPSVSKGGLREFFRVLLARFSNKRDVLVESKFEDTQTPVVVRELGG